MENKMKIGYARVSTEDQKLDLQLDSLNKAGCEKIYEEKLSGKNINRTELQNCLKSLRGGDTLVVWRLDRLARNLSDLINIVNDLSKNNIFIESITEKIETETATGKLIFHIFGALAEFERHTIRERVIAGIKAARKRGIVGGRKSKLNDKETEHMKLLFKDKTKSVSQIARDFNVTRKTVYNICNK